MERDDGQVLAVVAMVAGALLVAVPWRSAVGHRRPVRTLMLLALAMSLGVLVLLFGVFYAIYSFGDGGR